MFGLPSPSHAYLSSVVGVLALVLVPPLLDELERTFSSSAGVDFFVGWCISAQSTPELGRSGLSPSSRYLASMVRVWCQIVKISLT